ncbi:MAG: hypothetical protein F4Y02_09720 [Chloroflexi bacterium]|nr:hypothetical protein [Chloroflexota bacterium]
MLRVHGGPSEMQVQEATFFAFDDVCIPFRTNFQLHLIHGKRTPGWRDGPTVVVPSGEPGAHDEQVHYYGSTIRVGDEFRMWYIGRVGCNPTWVGGYQGYDGRLCYAVSRDGIHWTKPELGLVEYRGSTANNLVDFPQHIDLGWAPIIHDADDPDPDRRFKLAFTHRTGPSGNRRGGLCVAYSPNGLHWTLCPNNPVGSVAFEHSGLIKWNGCYYVNGHSVGHPGPGRKMETYASYDFEHWTEGSALSLTRSPRIEGPDLEDRQNIWEEVHMGAGLHSWGNVILGVYGQWHGYPYSDRRYVTIDLGLAISHDALHFHEPIPGFRFVPAFEERDTRLGAAPALQQGQGMENVGDKTLYWYSVWRGDGQVRLAQWERDRLGYVQPYAPASRAQLITCPFTVESDGSPVHLNVSGLGEFAAARVEVVDLHFRPLPGFSGDDAATLRESGLAVPVRWASRNTLPATDTPLRLKVDVDPVSRDCPRPDDVKIYAAYVGAASGR